MRLVVSLVALACLLGSLIVEAQVDVYDGALQPFSYAELQASVAPNGDPSFVAPESLMRPPPVAFPFDLPSMPASLQASSKALLNHQSLVEQALHTDPATVLVESQSSATTHANVPALHTTPLPDDTVVAPHQSDDEAQSAEPRFASTEAGPLSSSSSSGSLSASSGSLSLVADPASVSSTSLGASSSSGVTPVTSAKPLHRCVPKNGVSCVVNVTPTWTTLTVPKLDDADGSSSGSSSAQTVSASLSGSQSRVDGEAPVQEELSSNPEIARAQKEFYSKTQEVAREKRWVAEVRRIIDEYNGKIRNVQRHTQITEAELRKSRKTIVTMIKASKQAKLEKELQAALESLKKLESTSQALNGKMSELTQTKLGLKATISKIQQVITHSSKAGSAVMMQLQEAVKPTSDEIRLMEQEAANQGAKTLFGSLIQLVNEAHGRHQMHHQARVAKATKATKPEREALLSDADISARAAAIAAKYADEENQRLHTNLPLRALAATDLESDSELE